MIILWSYYPYTHLFNYHFG